MHIRNYLKKLFGENKGMKANNNMLSNGRPELQEKIQRKIAGDIRKYNGMNKKRPQSHHSKNNTVFNKNEIIQLVTKFHSNLQRTQKMFEEETLNNAENIRTIFSQEVELTK